LVANPDELRPLPLNVASRPTRRAFISLLPSALALSGCVTTQSQPRYTGPAYRVVDYQSREKPGSIIVDPGNHFLYSVQNAQQALQYDVGVGAEGYGWSGIATVHSKQEWPDWYPTADILQRKPEIRRYMVLMQSGGLGMPGGPANPLGARALYLWQGKLDTLYRIHGTNEPDSIGHDVSSGCIRMRNEAVIDLYDRTPIGTKVFVLATRSAGT
jgi:lipoprotein-anchoring transpeptidase ErfK/SrfK